MRKAYIAAAVSLICVLGLAVWLTSRDGKRQFASLEACREWAKEQGFKVSPDKATIGLGFWVIDFDLEKEPLPVPVLNTLKVRKGCVLIGTKDSMQQQIQFEKENSAAWGELVIWGDPDLIARLEKLR